MFLYIYQETYKEGTIYSNLLNLLQWIYSISSQEKKSYRKITKNDSITVVKNTDNGISQD